MELWDVMQEALSETQAKMCIFCLEGILTIGKLSEQLAYSSTKTQCVLLALRPFWHIWSVFIDKFWYNQFFLMKAS